jgi:two-component system, OmpR family, alkaline phosphatase synthesis response regulator PhoP
MPSRILVVEDEPGLRLAISDRLRAEGYDVATAADGDEGLRCASEQHFDLVVLDVMLPGRSGFDVCRDLRRRGVGSAVLMLTARGEVVDRVLGLKLGADDYLVKPFAMVELLARVEARLRDQRGADTAPRDAYRFGDVHVDFRRAEAKRDGRPVEMSAKELQLLRYFVEHRGAALSRDELLNGVWGYDAMPSTRTVDVHVAELRRKLEPDPHNPRYLVTLHRIGYKFVG